MTELRQVRQNASPEEVRWRVKAGALVIDCSMFHWREYGIFIQQPRDVSERFAKAAVMVLPYQPGVPIEIIPIEV